MIDSHFNLSWSYGQSYFRLVGERRTLTDTQAGVVGALLAEPRAGRDALVFVVGDCLKGKVKWIETQDPF